MIEHGPQIQEQAEFETCSPIGRSPQPRAFAFVSSFFFPHSNTLSFASSFPSSHLSQFTLHQLHTLLQGLHSHSTMSQRASLMKATKPTMHNRMRPKLLIHRIQLLRTQATMLNPMRSKATSVPPMTRSTRGHQADSAPADIEKAEVSRTRAEVQDPAGFLSLLSTPSGQEDSKNKTEGTALYVRADRAQAERATSNVRKVSPEAPRDTEDRTTRPRGTKTSHSLKPIGNSESESKPKQTPPPSLLHLRLLFTLFKNPSKSRTPGLKLRHRR